MGDIYTSLIPAAILFDSNGLTRERFLQRLLDMKDYFSIIDPGIHKIGEILEIPFTSRYKDFRESEIGKKDSDGLAIQRTRFSSELRVSESGKRDIRFMIRKHIYNKIEEEKEYRNEILFVKPKEGGICQTWPLETPMLITKILSVKSMGETGGHEMYEADFAAKEIKQIWKREEYRTLPKNCIFHHDNMYDFSKEEGVMRAGVYENKFFWKMDRKRYSIDKEKTFDNMKASRFGYKAEDGMTHMELGYTDFILTLEAMRKDYMRIVIDGPKNNKIPFLEKFPDVSGIYERAVWDSYMSIFAKSKGLTTSEFLRYRALGKMHGELSDLIRYDKE